MWSQQENVGYASPLLEIHVVHELLHSYKVLARAL